MLKASTFFQTLSHLSDPLRPIGETTLPDDLQLNHPNLETKRICHIVHYWKSRLLVTLAAITYRNVQHWANAHTKSYTPDSVDTEMMTSGSGSRCTAAADQCGTGREQGEQRQQRGDGGSGGGRDGGILI